MASSPERDLIEKFTAGNGMQLHGFAPYDEQILKADIKGETPLKYAEKSKGIISIHEMG